MLPPIQFQVRLVHAESGNRVVEVSGNLGVIDGFLLMVPIGKSESKACSKVGVVVPLLERSDKHPLDDEVDARLLRLS